MPAEETQAEIEFAPQDFSIGSVSAADGLKRYDSLVKVLLIGDSNVGKTTVLHAFVSDEFEPGFLSTIVIDFQTKIVKIRDKNIKLQIW